MIDRMKIQSAEEIWTNHLKALQAGSITPSTKGMKYKTVGEVRTALQNGAIIPEMMVACMERSLGVAAQIGSYALRDIYPGGEKRVKALFLDGLKKLNIY